MALHIQDPTDPDSEYLVDVLLDICESAICGAGAFAFLSSGGVKLLLRDERFKKFAHTGSFDLIVGVDAITDTRAIAQLDAARVEIPTLSASIHIPSHPRSIFHPKLAWFQTPSGGFVVAGSGNLTAGGLRWNIEAFSVQKVNQNELKAVRKQWEGFKARSSDNLYATDHPKVLAALTRNSERKKAEGFQKESVKTEIPKAGTAAPELGGQQILVAPEDEVPAVTSNTEVLIAEIPESGSRWKQANFHKEHFVEFFGASTTIARNAYLFHVHSDGSLGAQEVRPAVVVASHNYRFELEAASGIAYPSKGRPIGVFVKVAVRTFLYMLVMPTDADQVPLNKLLAAAVPTPGRKMRQAVFSAKEVMTAWPTSPLWSPLAI